MNIKNEVKGNIKWRERTIMQERHKKRKYGNKKKDSKKRVQ